MWFGEPHPFPERGSPTRLGESGQQITKGDRVDILFYSIPEIGPDGGVLLTPYVP